MVVGAKSQIDDRLTRTFSLAVASPLPFLSSGLEGQGYLGTQGGGVRGGEPLFRSIWQHQSLTGDQGFPSRTEIIAGGKRGRTISQGYFGPCIVQARDEERGIVNS